MNIPSKGTSIPHYQDDKKYQDVDLTKFLPRPQLLPKEEANTPLLCDQCGNECTNVTVSFSQDKTLMLKQGTCIHCSVLIVKGIMRIQYD